MSDALDDLVSRTLGAAPPLRPRLPARFEGEGPGSGAWSTEPSGSDALAADVDPGLAEAGPADSLRAARIRPPPGGARPGDPGRIGAEGQDGDDHGSRPFRPPVARAPAPGEDEGGPHVADPTAGTGPGPRAGQPVGPRRADGAGDASPALAGDRHGRTGGAGPGPGLTGGPAAGESGESASPVPIRSEPRPGGPPLGRAPDRDDGAPPAPPPEGRARPAEAGVPARPRVTLRRPSSHGTDADAPVRDPGPDGASPPAGEGARRTRGDGVAGAPPRTVVQVRIGRVEVRGIRGPAPTGGPAGRPAATAPTLALDAYLRAREEGRP